MKTDFNCPVCNSMQWQNGETFLYAKTDGERPYSKYASLLRKLKLFWRILIFARPERQTLRCNSLNTYEKLRSKVLFDVWFKDKKDEIELQSLVCHSCGFICYTPRPDDNDISEKYAYLNRHYGKPSNSHPVTQDVERAERIYRQCMEFTNKAQLNVLDYGGGDGRLLMPFQNDGHSCFVVDYYEFPIAGITKLGNDIQDAQIDRKFDIIICSHVLEHVSDVSNLLTRLKDYLKDDGILYGEVPQEVWAGLRIDPDPVTHINFFTKNSFLNLFLVHGFEILASKRLISNFGASALEVVWAIVRPNQSQNHNLLPVDTEEMLYPSRAYSLKRLYGVFVEPKLKKLQQSRIK
ncbi:MAG: class I SAM-dependent methyltransferase [Leptolyngbyaceae cyanobacterium]